MSKRKPFDSNEYAPETLAIRGGTIRSEFGEHSEALFMTSSFCFDTAEEAAHAFANATEHFVYSRFTNPTVKMFQDRLALLEEADACVATASGMSAVTATIMAAASAGDHIVCSKSVFGSITQLVSTIIPRFGIDVSFVNPTQLNEWQEAIRPNTRLFFLETPSNPLTEISDIAKISEIAHKNNILLAVDNCFCTSSLQKPLSLGADIVVHSATKYTDGQGRALGGAILGSHDFISEKLFPFTRITGPTMSAFNAWLFLKGLETLNLRMHQHSANALMVAKWLEKHPHVERVYYPGLPSHPQFDLAQKQQAAGGAVLSFKIRSGNPRAAAWQVIDQTRLCSITANLGDTRTTITHPATTTHGRVPEANRLAAGITDGLIRLAVGLENPNDIICDIAQGLDSIVD